jgi:hypothetical protein
MQRFDLKMLNNEEVKEQYQVKTSNRYAALKNTDDNVGIDRTWENIRGVIKFSVRESIGHYMLKQHKP